MPKLKPEKHHWWPKCVSRHWADEKGLVHWLSPDGTVRHSTPENFGVIRDGHHIKMGDDPVAGGHWDVNFEPEFDTADNNFPRMIDWLCSLDHCGPPFDRPLTERIMPQPVEDAQFATLIECLVSLAARSPRYREYAVSLAEHLRGPLPERERNRLIGANIQRTLRNAIRNVGGRGKAMIILSPEREFIFGDGFFHNLTVQGEHWHSPKILAPLTPWMSVLFASPSSYMVEPRLVTVVVSPAETEQLNLVVQVYARNALYYRSECPDIDETFSCGRHKVFSDHRNPVDRLIGEIPGVAPRDSRFDAVSDLIRHYSA